MIGTPDKVLKYFKSKFILVTLKQKALTTVNTEETSTETESPVSAGGYLIDTDKAFLYIGGDETEITHAISFKEVVAIQVYDPYTELLQSADLPKEFN